MLHVLFRQEKVKIIIFLKFAFKYIKVIKQVVNLFDKDIYRVTYTHTDYSDVWRAYFGEM